MEVPFFDLTRQHKTIQKEVSLAVERVLQSGKYVLGNEVEDFENAIKTYIGTQHAVGTNSCTDAIKIALVALGVAPGEEVLVVANTAIPTISAMREVGVVPVLVDIDDFYTMDLEDTRQKITSKTKAIIVVHLYGQPVDMPALMALAREKNLKVIEDCAQSTGATVSGKQTGTFGDISCFSFYPTKNIGAYGDGGMILTNNEQLYTQCKMLRMYGVKETYRAEIDGFNSRLDELQAAILHTKLPYLDTWNKRRQEIANWYATSIHNPHIALPKTREGSMHVFHQFVIRTPHRDALKKYLAEKNIGTAIHYPYPIHEQAPYKQFAEWGSLPKTEVAAKEILSLPIFPELTQAELEYISQTLNEFQPQ